MTTKLYTTRQVAEMLELSEWTVRQKIASGELRAVNVGGLQRPTWRISQGDIDAFLSGLPEPGAELKAATDRLG